MAIMISTNHSFAYITPIRCLQHQKTSTNRRTRGGGAVGEGGPTGHIGGAQRHS